MRSNWLRAFWPKPQEQDFSQILDLCRKKANNNKHFHYRTNSLKIVTNFFKLKKNYFSSKKVFPKKSGCHAQLHEAF